MNTTLKLIGEMKGSSRSGADGMSGSGSSSDHVPPAMQSIPPIKGKPPRLSKRMTVEQAFREIIHNCLFQIQANRDSVAAGKNSESLHQMRVGLRRLNSAFDLFAHVVRLPGDLRRELDWLSGCLGSARDWDVLRSSTLPGIEDALPEKVRISGLKAAIAAKVEDKFSAAAKAVKSRRYERLMRGVLVWLDGDGDGIGRRKAMPYGDRKRLGKRISGLADDRLSRAERRLFKRGKCLRGATPKARHRVRIAAKKARYAVEFFQSLLPGKATRRYVKSLSGLQDELGRLNDLAVAGRLLGDLTDERGELQDAAEFVRGYLMGFAEEQVEGVEGLWKRFRRVDVPGWGGRGIFSR
jgi:triphosphatase